MRVRSALFRSALVMVLGAPSLALADAPNEPCDFASAGDACVTLDGADGTCVMVNGFLDCVEGGATASTSTGTTTAATTTGATTTAATGAGGAGGGAETGSGGSGSTGSTAEDDGCAVRAPSGKTTGRVGAGLIFLGAAAVTARRWARRARAAQG